jgi:hypothetical protein
MACHPGQAFINTASSENKRLKIKRGFFGKIKKIEIFIPNLRDGTPGQAFVESVSAPGGDQKIKY